MTTAMVINDLDDHDEESGREMHGCDGIWTGTPSDSFQGQDDSGKAPAPLPWQGRHRGHGDVPKDVPGTPLTKSGVTTLFIQFLMENSVWTFLCARIHFPSFCPFITWRKHYESSLCIKEILHGSQRAFSIRSCSCFYGSQFYALWFNAQINAPILLHLLI